MRLGQLWFFVVVALLIVNISQVRAFEIRIVPHDSFPKYYFIETDGKKSMQGLCIDILHAIERVEPSVQFVISDKIVPVKRRWAFLKAGKIDAIICSSSNAERLKEFNFVKTPLYQLNRVIGMRRNDPTQIASFDDIRALDNSKLKVCENGKRPPKGTILTLLGSGGSRYIDAQGGLINKPAHTIPEALKQLVDCEAQFIYYHDLGLKSRIKQMGLQDQLKVLPESFRVYYHRIAFGKSVPHEVVDKVDAAVVRITASGEIARLYSKYTNIETSQP